MALRVNMDKSGLVPHSVPSQIRITIEGDNRDELDTPDARDLAIKAAADVGFGNVGFNNQPNIGPVDVATGEIIETLDPKLKISCWRAEFELQQRL